MLPPVRSLHFVPGANEKMLDKSVASAADALVLDLEDAVTPDNKDSARETVASWLQHADFKGKFTTVRMNPLSTPWGVNDLRGIMGHPPDAIVVPKVESAKDIFGINAILRELERANGHEENSVGLVVIATETPKGVLNIKEIAESPRINALSWGAEDLSAAIGALRNRDEHGNYLDVFRHCRTMTLLAATASEIQPIDTVFTDIKDLDGLRRECISGADQGFTGKITIHPAQIDIVNEVFSPSADDIERATALIEAFAENEKQGLMAFSFRGQMVDVPHLEQAKRIIARAESLHG